MYTIFFENPLIKTNASYGAHLPLKNEAPPPSEKQSPLHWNVKHPSMKWFLEKAQ